MALVLKDRVKEQTTTTGTGAVTLGGAISGFDTFAAVGNSNTTYYAIVSQSANEWEVGIGTYTASGTTLSRDTILESSNSDSAVNFSAGTKDVFVTYPADKSVYADAAGTVNTGAIAATSLTLTTDLAVADGGTGASSLTDGGVLLGSGTGAITPMAVLTDGQMIVGDGTGDPVAESGATLRTSIGVDAAGTDNSTNVTLAGSLDYLTISGQEITRGAVVLTTDISGTLPIANGGTNATSAGAARTALGAAASGANSDITSITGLTTDLTVAQGGTGAGTFAANGILFGNGTSAIGATAVGTDGQILTSNGSGVAPTFQDAAAGGATSINGLSDAAADNDSLYLGEDVGNGNTAANTGVGQSALLALDGTVYGNTALGQKAGKSITSALTNTCLGYKAGEDITTGPDNIIIGPDAAKTLTTGNDNIVIGSDECGENLSTGDNNTIIGPRSGKATATNSQCLILGHNANPSSNSVAREITLGSSSITSFRIPGVGFYSLSGDVGIGTASPSQKLTVEGTDARIYLTGANTDINMTGTADGQLSLDGNGYGFGIALNSSGANLYTNSASRALILGTDETERVRITGTGNVGIGTSSPNEPITVQRNGTAVAGLSPSTVASFQSTGSSAQSSYLNIIAGSSGSSAQAAIFFGDADDPDIGKVLYRNSDDSMDFVVNASSRMKILSSGNVGIGTASPAKQLSITKSALATINTLTDGATITPDFDAGQNFSVTLAGNRTLANPTNIDAGQTGSIFITQDGTGSRTLSFGSYWDFAGGTAPTLSTAAGAVDRIDYIVRTGTSIHAVATLNLS